MVEYILVTFSKVLIQQFLFNISFVLKHACSHEKKNKHRIKAKHSSTKNQTKN